MTLFNFFNDKAHTVFIFDGPNGPIKVAAEAALSGVYLFVEGFEEPVAKVDVHSLLAPEGDGQDAPRIIVYDTRRDEAVAFGKFHSDGTRVSFERGVIAFDKDRFGDPAYGYLLEM